MSLDGLAMRAVSEELCQNLINGRIDKIQQPDKLTLLLSIRANGSNHRLLLSAHPQTARIGLIEEKPEQPAGQPPLFCMVLRKHLEGAKILNIYQVDWERILRIDCQGRNEIGELTTRTLIFECMGKHSNIILLDPETNTILDGICRLGIDDNHYRQILPGITYIAPPPQDKTPMEDISPERLSEWFLSNPTAKLQKVLLQHLAGFGPQSIRELLIRSDLDPDQNGEYLGQYDYDILWQQIQQLQKMAQDNAWQPTIVFDGEKPIAFAPFHLVQFDTLEQKCYPSLSSLLEAYVGVKERANLLIQQRTDLEHIVQREIERCQRKLALQTETIQQAEDAEQYKHHGELLIANLYQIKQGPSAHVIDYYDPAQPVIEIAMEPHRSPKDNAQIYFKKYNKAKIGAQKARIQLALTQEELAYLESIRNGLQQSQSIADLADIRLELESAGYVKAKLTKQIKKSKNEPIHQIMTVHQDGFELLIGKNNVQNDYLTLRIARLGDTWLHAKDIPGSHVIIRNHQEKRNIPKKILDLAANFAAYFSKSRNSSLVPVDYTLRKYVRKPNGAKPGMVIYDNQKTIYITPDEEEILQLLQKEKSSDSSSS